jgi:hypothetical protein
MGRLRVPRCEWMPLSRYAQSCGREGSLAVQLLIRILPRAARRQHTSYFKVTKKRGVGEGDSESSDLKPSVSERQSRSVRGVFIRGFPPFTATATATGFAAPTLSRPECNNEPENVKHFALPMLQLH